MGDVAKHRHRFGACHGVLRVEENRVVYDSSDRDQDDKEWSYSELNDVDFQSETKLTLTASSRSKRSLGLTRKKYTFESEAGPFALGAVDFLARHVGQ